MIAFLYCFYWTCLRWCSPKWRWHYSAWRKTSQTLLRHVKISKISIFMICRIVGNLTDPEEPLLLTLALHIFKDTKNESLTSRYCFWKYQNLKHRKGWKRRVPDTLEIGLIRSGKSWIWDQYLSKTWNRNPGFFQLN